MSETEAFEALQNMLAIAEELQRSGCYTSEELQAELASRLSGS